jgi:glycosyltransferase involved in cell wall biosynthesis
MRVLMISSHHMQGRYFEDFARGAQESNLELGFMWLSTDTPPDWLADYNVQNLTVVSSREGNVFFQILQGIHAISKFRPDIIQSHLFRGGIVAMILGRITRTPTVLTRHHITEHIEVGSRFHQFIDRISAIAANHVIVFSQAAKVWLIEREGINAEKITVINQGFDFAKLEPLPNEVLDARIDLGFTSRTFNLVCIARYSKTKGQLYLVKAIAELIELIPDIRLVFIGPGNSDWLASIVNELNLKEFIRLEGFRPNIPAYIAAADLVVHPSLVDAFSQLLIEAQGVGAPLIATDIAAAREQIEDGMTGIIVQERSSSELALAILRLHNDRALMNELGVNGAKSVRERFTVSRMLKETEECFTKVLSGSV